VTIVSSESFADSSHAGIVEQHIHYAHSSMCLTESATPSSSGRLQSSIKLWKQELINIFNYYCLQKH